MQVASMQAGPRGGIASIAARAVADPARERTVHCDDACAPLWAAARSFNPEGERTSGIPARSFNPEGERTAAAAVRSLDPERCSTQLWLL